MLLHNAAMIFDFGIQQAALRYESYIRVRTLRGRFKTYKGDYPDACNHDRPYHKPRNKDG